MAKGGGIWRDQLNSLLRTTWQGLDTVREVVVKKSRAGRIQLDVALLKRRRKDTLASLGAIVARLAANGRIDEEAFPELSAALAKLDALDERIAAEERRAHAASMGIEAEPPEAAEEYVDDDVDDEASEDEPDLDTKEE